MSRTNTTNKKRSRNKGGFGDWEFVDVKVTKADKASFKDWSTKTAADSVDLLSTLVNSGYKLSVSWSDYSDCYTASLSCTEEGLANYHLVMTSRSDELWEAVMLALYKHYVMCHDETWPTDKPDDTWG